MAGFTVGADRVDARAWVCIASDGTDNDSYGVSSVSSPANGTYLVNYSTAFSAGAYAVVASADTGGAKREISTSILSTSQSRIRIFDTVAGYVDRTSTLVAFGN